jgi:TolA-binding protein
MKLPLLVLVGLFAQVCLASTSDHPPVESPPVADDTAPAAPVTHTDATPAVDNAPAVASTTSPAATPATSVDLAQEIASMLRIGEAKLLQQDWASAQLAFQQVLNSGRHTTPAQVRQSLLGLARAYRGDQRLTKACAIYERYIKDHPADEQLPAVYLELGRCLRALGAHRLAIARFYSVLNSTLKLPDEGVDSYRQLARTAQFEIAETYFLSGDYEQAFRFYSRLRLLDLAPADRARAAFKSAYALNLQANHEQAVTEFRAYLSLYPDGDDAPETRYLLSVALRRLGRAQESLAATLELLKIEKSRTAAAPKIWSHWQRKTGNQLANEFYEQGDTLAALTIYQCMHDLGGPPEWLLPVQYQIGLCQERLQQPALARQTYGRILDALRAPSSDPAKRPAIMQDIGTMVDWRLKHLDWLETAAKQAFLFNAPDKVAALPSPPVPAVSATP